MVETLLCFLQPTKKKCLPLRMPGENCVEIGIHDGGDFAKGHTSKVMEIHNPDFSWNPSGSGGGEATTGVHPLDF